jgi:hypothetical protein
MEISFLPFLHFLWCMAQRSLHAITKVYYRSMSCFAMISWTMVPSCSGKVSHTNIPSCTMWFSQVTKYITMYDAIPYLISKQAIPYLTHGSTCCPGVSTPKIQSLADASMTNHITWWNPTICTILTLLKPHHQSSPWSTHISIDGRPSLTKTQAKLNITKDGKACTTLMTTWLSKTNQVWTQILKYEA